MLQIHTQSVGDVIVLTLTGQLIHGSESRSLAEQIRDLGASGTSRVLVDLSGVGFIDSAGVGELVASYSTLKKAGGDLRLCSPVKMVRQVLKLVRLPTMISLFETQTEGLSSFNTPESNTQ